MSTVEFFGESFTLNPGLSADALADLADATVADDGSSPAAVIATRALVWDCIAAADLERFKVVSRANRAGPDDWTNIIEATVRQVTDRPTVRSSDSSDGPTVTPAKSGASSDGKDLGLLLPGRPDLQLAVVRQRQAV